MIARGVVLIVAVTACSAGGRSGAASSAATPAPAPRTGTVIVANMGDNTATLLDLASSRVIATLPTGNGAHEVAVSHDGRWAVVSNYGVRGAPGNSLTVIDVPAGIVTRTIDLGDFKRPHGSAFLPGDSIFVVTSEVSRAIVLVNFREGSVAGSIPTNHPASHMLAVPTSATHIYTSNVADGTVSDIDVTARRFAREFTVAPAVEGITVTPDGEQVWVGSNQAKTVSVIDTKTGTIMDTLSGFGMPYRLAVTPDGRTVIITDPPNAAVRIVDRATRKDRTTVKIPADGVTDKAEFPGSPSPEGIVLSRDGRTAFVALQGSSRVAVIDIATAQVVATLPTGAGPDGIAYSPFGR